MYSCEAIDPVAPQHLKTEDVDEMRPQGQQISDRLTVEVDCRSLGPSECPSMTSSFSPLDSPTPTPTSLYSQNSLASPGWHEPGQYHSQSLPMERRTSATPLRSAFRMADLTSSDGMGMPCGAMDRQDQMPMADYLPGYDENVEQFWIPQDMPKTYENPTHFPYQAPMPQYNQMARNYYRPQQTGYLPESASNPCLSRPIFNQPERMPNSVSMANMLQWMPSSESMAPQTITPAQAFPANPVTPPSSSYSDFPPNLQSFKAQTPSTPVRSVSLGTPSGTDTPVSRLSGGGQEYSEEFPLSPVYRDGFLQRTHRQASRKPSKKQLTRSNLSLENLPPIIKQVQFKCKEPGCKGRFKRQEHLKRHMKSHSKEKPHICWVPGCHRAFSRSDNLNAHYTKTHSKRGGRNRYVATLDEASQDYDPDFRGQLTADGRPLYGTKLEDPIPDCRELSVDVWDD
ncbi:hypothetical protein NUU61_000080 [Penicillium alfredii]|uniref:C2H2 type master regulator of conidiophore development brlA n=1 Tax=Penicillium alfredii TaxID=1506179 RepID=A0A9W9G946_9EURO|nr:uncharacterized protein NUU61_000080 [Penicillium alfredii]KAJ5114321.1 hypothetical protein NUU61_000080 [Penicillium alfredii]